MKIEITKYLHGEKRKENKMNKETMIKAILRWIAIRENNGYKISGYGFQKDKIFINFEKEVKK